MGIRQLIIKRAVNAIILVFIVLTLNFFIFRLVPGNPVLMMISPDMTSEARLSMISKFGLDKPLHIQYVNYIREVFQGNLGVSFVYARPVFDLVFERIPATILLLFSSYIITVILSVTLGLVAAWKRGSKFDIASIVLGLSLHSMPWFWFGGLLLMYFSVNLRLFPVTGLNTPWLVHENVFSYIKDIAYHLFLPMMTIGIGSVGGLFYLTRNSLLNVFSEDYITTAKALGLKDRTILLHNALRNAMLPLTTIIMMRLGFIIGGSLIIEMVFTWPGVGILIYWSVMAQDYPVLQGAFLIITITVVFFNFIAEIMYGYLDPRIRYE